MALYEDKPYVPPRCANPKPPYFLTAYEIAVKHGFQGTEEEWLESLSAWKLAQEAGFDGTFDDWVYALANPGNGSGGGTNTEKDEEGNRHVSGGGDTIVNVGTPENPTDAANKEYVDRVIVEKVTEKVIYVETKEDGSKVEHVTGGNQTIVDVAKPENPTDAANREYVDTALTTMAGKMETYVQEVKNKAMVEGDDRWLNDNGDTMYGVLSMAGFGIKNIATPIENGDAVNKDYADKRSVLREFLFTNTDITSEFAAQVKTISNLQDFDKFEVECYGDSGISEVGALRATETVLYDGGTVRMLVNATVAYEGAVVQVFRGFVFSGTTIQIYDCYRSGGTGTSLTTWNTMLIPTKIIGIKYGGAGIENLPRAEEVLFG